MFPFSNLCSYQANFFWYFAIFQVFPAGLYKAFYQPFWSWHLILCDVAVSATTMTPGKFPCSLTVEFPSMIVVESRRIFMFYSVTKALWRIAWYIILRWIKGCVARCAWKDEREMFVGCYGLTTKSSEVGGDAKMKVLKELWHIFALWHKGLH